MSCPPCIARARLLGAVVVLGVLASACQLRIATDVSIGRGGAGTMMLALGLDQELDTLLTDSGADPARGVDELAATAPDWSVSAEPVDGGGRELRFEAEFGGPLEFRDLTLGLQSALSPDDGALFRDLEIRVAGDGSVTFSGEAGLALPTTTGAEGDGVAFDGDDLAALIAEQGDRVVRYDLRVTLPADPVEHDADTAEGATLTWQLPVDGMRSVRAVSAPPTTSLFMVIGGVFGVTLLVVALLVVVLRRRAVIRRRRANRVRALDR